MDMDMGMERPETGTTRRCGMVHDGAPVGGPGVMWVHVFFCGS